MDDIDQRLLAAITDNARMPVRQVAERAGVSREVADYRLKRLEEKDIIRGYKARVDLSRFSQDTYIMFLRLQRLEAWNRVLDFLREAKYPHWIGRVSGNWDALFLFSTNSKKDLNEFLASVFEEFGDDLQDHILLTLTQEYKDTFSTLFGGTHASSSPDGQIDLPDEVDKQIIRMLADNAKATNKEMAEQVGLTDEAVRYRVSKLEEKQIILGYRAIIDLKKAGLKQYAVTLEFSGISSERESLLKELLTGNKDIFYSARTIGASEAVFMAAAKSDEEFHHALRKLRNKMAGFLSGFEATPVLEVPVHDTVSEALLG